MLLTISNTWKTSARCSAPNRRMIAALMLTLMTPLVLASDTKRVTVPIALPFQQQSSAALSSAPAAVEPTPYSLQTTQFTQTPGQPVGVAVSSVAAAVSAAESANTLSPSLFALPPSAEPLVSQPVVATQTIVPAIPVEMSSSLATSSPPAASASPASKAEASTATKTAQTKPTQPAVAIPLVTTAPIKAQRHPVGHPDAFVAEFEDYVAKKIAPFVPGVSIVVVSGGQIKSLRAFGVRRAGTREQLTPDTVFRLASLSKPVSATAASVLVNEGRITWDTTITSVLPKVSFKNTRYGNQLTLRHALSQSTGLPRHTYSHYIDQNMNYSDVVNRLRYVNFACAPGKCYAYQNVAYSLAGDMIKAKAGTSFESYVGKKVFEPLGMRSASFGLASYNASPNRAAPHIANGNRWVPTAVVPNWYKVAPAAGVNASIVDMSKFLLGQIGRRQDALPLSVLKPIQSRVTKNTPEQNYYGAHKAAGNTAYGLGWRVFDYGRNKNFVHHGGHVKGFRTEMVFNRDLQIGMVFLTNSETRLARDVIFKFLDMHERAQHAARVAKKN